jgi:hypothetical protein
MPTASPPRSGSRGARCSPSLRPACPLASEPRPRTRRSSAALSVSNVTASLPTIRASARGKSTRSSRPKRTKWRPTSSHTRRRWPRWPPSSSSTAKSTLATHQNQSSTSPPPSQTPPTPSAPRGRRPRSLAPSPWTRWTHPETHPASLRRPPPPLRPSPPISTRHNILP